jgi:senataxin
VDNIILKIMEDGFVDGSGQRYNPSMIRVGVGQSAAVSPISLENKVNQILTDADIGQVDSAILGYKMELQRLSKDIANLRRRCHAIADASPWPLGRHWEIRVDENNFDQSGRCFFVNHKEQSTTYECPPPPEPGEAQFQPTSMPEYRAFMQRIVKSVENYFSVKSSLERNIIIKGSMESGANNFALKQSLESHVLNSVHMVMTTLGTAGSRVFEGADRFEVVVIDEAAQSVEPATLAALQLGSRHCVLVGAYNLYANQRKQLDHLTAFSIFHLILQVILNNYLLLFLTCQVATRSMIEVFSNAWKKLGNLYICSMNSIVCIRKFPISPATSFMKATSSMAPMSPNQLMAIRSLE